MHIPDGFLDPKMSGGLLGAALGAFAFCLSKVMNAVTAIVPQQVLAAVGNSLGNVRMAGRRILTEIGEKKIKKMAQVAAWVFAFQMFNFPIGSGTSGHLIGGVFAVVVLGPSAGMIVISVVLAVQALFFADGGLMALGGNIINMAVLGSFGSYYIYAGLKRSFSEVWSIAMAAWLSVVLASLACAVEIGLSGTIGLKDVIVAMMKVHGVIGIFEALITIFLIKIFKEKE
jgi:cobalt/nickel transport system permease protein